MEKPIYSVAALNQFIKTRLESDERLSQCHVSGEISNFKHHSSGHMYFTLKDESSRLRAVMFSSRNRNLPFRPEDGMKVVCRGSVGVFERDGQYQLYVDAMQPDGLGALYVAYEQLKKKLTDEGLFDVAQKKSLPRFPTRIGVVTSPTGAVLRDICTTLQRRYPLAKVFVAPALVQGPDAAASLVAGLNQLKKVRPAIDVIVIGRGGGSLEELWPFNEEIVVRAVAGMSIPVISAVGHETDVTLCDFAADVRAATPTAAAELVAPHQDELFSWINESLVRAHNAWRQQSLRRRERIENIDKRPVFQQPTLFVDKRRQSLDFLQQQLQSSSIRPLQLLKRRLDDFHQRVRKMSPERRLKLNREKVNLVSAILSESVRRNWHNRDVALERKSAALVALNPLSVLSRGFSVVYSGDGPDEKVVSLVEQVHPQEILRVRLSNGEVKVRHIEGSPH
ncbi:MAG: exodeoxyribonuclease VII large subunit [Alicyclobacillaceae bacterium]|uniref:exodeoxyribonuclease VII large subunit n=1 Tax=Alicyclobacillus sp. SP_1 TaxID=2942475 RepID=UPI00215799DA|nr:exodeoxyribonuclease VII large subunit [Alicyclobacillus sp. SP_1]MCY0888960.1 exodeoxyribonuclease VII large subunit [Alicyclobacillaceae bacterium]MCY0897129.1 exodeoxyribonuclease VII large subunit [Alicyclobacillaceae bacterium]